MDISQYTYLLRKWAWLIALGAVLAGGVSFLALFNQPPLYEAGTIVAIGGYFENPNPDRTQIQVGVDLAATYATLAQTRDILEATINKLSLPFDANRLEEMTTTEVILSTSLVRIKVTYKDPELAAVIANELTNQLISQSPTNITDDQRDQINFLNEQISLLNEQLRNSRERITQLDEEIANIDDTREIARLNVQRDAIINNTNQAYSTIAQFSSTLTSLQQRSGALNIVESARVPQEPKTSGILNATIVAALVGAFLAAGVGIAFEYFNDTIKSNDEAVRATRLPLLGTISKFDKSSSPLLGYHSTTAPLALEDFRKLRNHLLFATEDKQKNIYLITSSGSGEGKSTVAANLAISIAQSGRKVLLIDADLRRPTIHKLFDKENDIGLTTLLKSMEDQPAVSTSKTKAKTDDNMLSKIVETTKLPNLYLITSGAPIPNSIEILGSSRLQSWIEQLKTSYNIDIVLFDSPPCPLFADGPTLAATTEAEVIFIVTVENTRRSLLLKAKEQFASLNIHVRGLIINLVNRSAENSQLIAQYKSYGVSGETGSTTNN